MPTPLIPGGSPMDVFLKSTGAINPASFAVRPNLPAQIAPDISVAPEMNMVMRAAPVPKVEFTPDSPVLPTVTITGTPIAGGSPVNMPLELPTSQMTKVFKDFTAKLMFGGGATDAIKLPNFSIAGIPSVKDVAARVSALPQIVIPPYGIVPRAADILPTPSSMVSAVPDVSMRPDPVAVTPSQPDATPFRITGKMVALTAGAGLVAYLIFRRPAPAAKKKGRKRV